MKLKGYFNKPNIVAGTTVKEPTLPVENSMALHTGHKPKDVLHNRMALADLVEEPLDHFVCAHQTHSDHFYRVETVDRGRGAISMEQAIADTDALYTYEPHIVLSSFTADCVPILFYHEDNGLIGAIHSGWQGTVKEVTKKLFTHLKEEEQCDLSKVHVQLGMALSQEKFEVDEDVYLQFKQLGYADEWIYFNEKTNKYHIDNQRVVQKQCELAGILANHITVDRTCTFIDEEGFSHRQDRNAGRHISVIVRKS